MNKMRNVELEISNGCGFIRLCRPAKANAYNNEMLKGIDEAISKWDSDRKVFVITIEGTEGYFCAGADLGEIEKRTVLNGLDILSAKVFDNIAGCSKPVIAVIDGPAIGGGLELALACDLRIATSRSIFAFPETSLGIIPAAGGVWRLPRLVGESVAKQMILFGVEATAEKALSFGLVDKVVEPETLKREISYWVESIKDKNPEAVRLGKKAIEVSISDGFASNYSNLVQGVLYGLKGEKDSEK